MKKTIFLDRDGTINVDKGYVYRIDDFEFLPGVLEALKIFQNLGYQLVIITNQSGIARGYYTVEEYENLNKWLLKKLKENKITITKSYYCPHLREGSIKEYSIECECRKPKLGLFFKAIDELEIDMEHSYAIGDRLRDLSICHSTSVKGILLSGEENVDYEILESDEYYNGKISFKKNLLEAAQDILYQRL